MILKPKLHHATCNVPNCIMTLAFCVVIHSILHHCPSTVSSVKSVWMVVCLICHGATLFFYYVSVDGCCSNMPWGYIVLLLCQCGRLLF